MSDDMPQQGFQLWKIARATGCHTQAMASCLRRDQQVNDRRLATLRGRAWKNAMVAAINAGLEQKLFGLQQDENWWPGAAEKPWPGDTPVCLFDFAVGDIPGRAAVWDAGWDELRIHSVLWPTVDCDDWISVSNVTDGRDAVGGVAADGWMERRDGCYLQPSPSLFYCATAFKARVAALDIEPHGFADRGRFRM